MKLLFALIFSSALASAQSFNDSFPNVTKSINLPKELVTLYFDPSNSVLLNSPHPKQGEYQSSGIYISRPLKFKLNATDKEWIIMDCDSGGSSDPECTFYRQIMNQLTSLGSISGSNFILAGNGNVYTIDHFNQMFKKTSKFSLINEKFEEVDQPFYYVGLKSYTTQQVELYSDIESKHLVATLSKGSNIEVLINDKDRYLIKTPAGLTGWLTLPSDTNKQNTPIIDLYFNGD